MEDYKREMGKRLSAYRKELHLTQEKVSEMLDISLKHYSLMTETQIIENEEYNFPINFETIHFNMNTGDELVLYTDGITEEQFIGYWLCYNNSQNENLSKSISPIFSLAKYMNDHFRTDKADPYTVQLYSQMSEEIGNDFNNSAANKDSQTYDDDYTTDYDNDER